MRLRSTRLTAIANAIRDKFYGAALNMRFDNTTSLDPRVTFSRTTNATVTNSSGLIANAPMNLLTFSEQFDNAAWSKNNATITANSIAAPNGTTTADTLVSTATLLAFTSQTTPTLINGQNYTASRYVKAGSKNFCTMGLQGLADAFFDLENLTTSFSGTGAVSASIIDVGNGWRRISATWTWGSGTTYTVFFAMASSLSSFSGLTVGDTQYTWGAQLELGSTATTYNPTTVKNLLGFTENFDNAAWTKSNAFVQTNLLAFSAFNAIGTSSTTNAWYETSAALDTTVNSAIAPDGTQTAALLAINSATSFAAVFQVPTTATANTYAYSVYCKAVSTDTTCRLLLSGDASLANFVRANFTLSGAGSASVADVSGTAVSAATPTIQAVGDGWYRCTIAGTLTAPTSTRVLVYPGNPGAQTTASQTLVWGAQLVQGTTPGDYKATYAAAAAVGYTDIYGQPFAQKLVENTANDAHALSNNITVTSGTLYTFSCYAKRAERKYLRLVGATNFVGSVNFDLDDGSFTVTAGTPTVSVTPIGNGWFRCAITAVTAATTITPNISMALNSTGTGVYQGDGTSGIYIFGAQLSDSASVDPYVYQPVAAPTSTAYYGPRFDYDPVTLAPKGLLIEEQRTNLVTYSEQFDNVAWAKTNASLTANRPDPAGGTKAFTLTASGGSATVQQAPTVTSGVALSASIWVKRVTGTGAINMRCGDATTIPVTVTSQWTRVAVTATPTSTTGRFAILVATDGDAIDIWGAQLEAGSFATSYIPTVASQVTRAADNASMIGNNFARWFNQTAGTVFVQADTVSASINAAAFALGSTTSDIMRIFRQSDAQPVAQVIAGGAAQATLGMGASNWVISATPKIAFSYATNDFSATANGGTTITDTSGTVPIVSQAVLGNAAGIGALNGHLTRLAFYSRVLASSEQKAITS